MFQINTTKDIMFLVIAFCILLFTIFIVWLLSYFIKIIKDISKVVDGVNDKVEKIGSLIDLCKNKVEKSTTHFVILAEALKEIIKFVMKRKEQKKAKIQKK